VSTIKVIAATLGTIVLIGAVAFLVQGTDFFLYRAFAPAYEATRRSTFEQSKAYNDGMAHDLQDMQIEYARASSDRERAVIRSVVVDRFAGYDESRLTPSLSGFLDEMRAAQTGGAK